MSKKIELSVQTVLELSCSAQRKLGKYVKESDVWLRNLNPRDSANWVLPNKWLIQSTLGLMEEEWTKCNLFPPKNLIVNDDDRTLADEIRSFYRRLAFTVIANEDGFDSSVFSILNNDLMLANNIGFIAYLPSKYEKDVGRNRVKKIIKNCESGYLGNPDEWLSDLDSEILEVSKSKNFDAFNITAIVENKMCSWMSKNKLEIGPAVIVRAKIKEHSKHWLHENSITRLNYVKSAQ